MRGSLRTRWISCALRHQQDLADVGALVERILAGGPVDRGGLEQLPAVEDRLRVDLAGALAGGLDREVEVGGEPVVVRADLAEDGAGDDLGALLERLGVHRLLVEAEDAGEVGLEGLVARDAVAEHRRRAGRRGRHPRWPCARAGRHAVARVLGVDGSGALGLLGGFGVRPRRRRRRRSGVGRLERLGVGLGCLPGRTSSKSSSVSLRSSGTGTASAISPSSRR